MSDNIGRIFGAIGALAALWVVVYWWWEPSHPPRISMDTTIPASATAAIVEPRSIKPRAADPSAAAPLITPTPAPPPSNPPQNLAVIPPQFRDYTIRGGDTMEAIAERELGSRKHADALRSANPLMDPEHLKIGRTIRIPLDPTNIQGKPVAAEPPSAPPVPATAPTASAVIEYTIKDGDTLSGIAKARYGSTKYKDLIFEANRDTLNSEDDLREGRKLRLPPKPN